MLDVDRHYREYGAMVLRRCRQLLRSEDRAVDALHDVFVQLLRSEDRLRDERPGSLLLRIATNVCLNELRRHRRHPEDELDEAVLEIAAAEEPEARSLARLAARHLLGREEESTRTMAIMHFVDGLTLEEIGREVGLSAAGVRKRLRGMRTRVAALAELDSPGGDGVAARSEELAP